MNRHDEAKKYAEKVLEMDSKNLKALLKKGTIHSYLKEYHKAIEFFNKALEVEPTNEEASKGLQDT